MRELTETEKIQMVDSLAEEVVSAYSDQECRNMVLSEVAEAFWHEFDSEQLIQLYLETHKALPFDGEGVGA